MLKSLLQVRSEDEIALALDGLQILFPGQPISLRMIHGKAMIGHYRGFQSAVNAAIKAQETHDRGAQMEIAGVGARSGSP